MIHFRKEGEQVKRGLNIGYTHSTWKKWDFCLQLCLVSRDLVTKTVYSFRFRSWADNIYRVDKYPVDKQNV